MPSTAPARCFVSLLVGVLYPVIAAGQEAPRPPANETSVSRFGPAAIARAVGPLDGVRFDDRAKASEERSRACPGCPTRILWRPYVESLAIDVFYNTINRMRGHGSANVGPRSWWANMKHGFEWDANTWFINQFGHPYQGSDYFTSGRAHGLTFWEATSVAAFGSATWEYFAENNRASLNDLINTTLGGITLGEIRHRLSWLIRAPTLDGKSRKKRELIAAGIDPMGFLARTFSGDAKRISEKPASLIPSRIGSGGSAGVAFQATSSRDPDSQFRPFVEMDLEYGDVRNGASRTAYDAFTLNFAVGSRRMTQGAVRGRLYSKPAKTHMQISLFQTYDFIVNRAYSFGGQGFEVEIASHAHFSPRTMLWMAVTGGANVLGAIDLLILPPPGIAFDQDMLDRRFYDFGPGGRIGGLIQLVQNGRRLGSFGYNGYQVSVVDGGRSNHVAQRLYLDLRLPLKRAVSLGAAGELFYRKVYVFPTGLRSDSTSQFRVFLAWDRR